MEPLSGEDDFPLTNLVPENHVAIRSVSSELWYCSGMPAITHIENLRNRLRGPVLGPEDSVYDEARRGWNGLIDRRPSMIARCLGLTDVAETILFAREHEMAMTVRAGGHSVAGKSVQDGALMLDLSLMRHVAIDPVRRRAVAQAGATYSDFDARTHAYGLATTGGVISSTGIAGLTLGGGIGWLMGKHGLACDNLISAEVIDASGRCLKASAEEHADLFWAIRGGGGNFGMAATFEYQLHPLQAVLGGALFYPRLRAWDVLRSYRDLTAGAPDDLTAYAALTSGPDGAPLVALALCCAGENRDVAERDVARFRSVGIPRADLIGWKSYPEMQTLLDVTAPKGLLYYFKCTFLTELSDEALRTIISYAESAPAPLTNIILEHVHGKASRVSPDATAFALRRNQYSLNIVPGWQDPGMNNRCVQWGRAFAAEMERFGPATLM